MDKANKRVILLLIIVAVVIIVIIASISIVQQNNPSKPDRDGDGIPDDDDEFPDDPSEWKDTDGDGHGDNYDAFPTNSTEWMDSDNDGVGDNSDGFPNDPLETSDFDNDTIGDNADPDDDNDGVPDTIDAFPHDPSEWEDWDGDGIGDNSDSDILRQITVASSTSDDSNYGPNLVDYEIYFYTYNWWLFSSPPKVDSQDVNVYDIAVNATNSIYHDNIKTPPAIYGDAYIEEIQELAASSDYTFFTKDNIIKQGSTVYRGFSSELYQVVSGSLPAKIVWNDLYQYCSELKIHKDRLVYTRTVSSNSSVYLYNATSAQKTKINPIENAKSPDIFGDNIVYIYDNGSAAQVMLFNISSMIYQNVTDLNGSVVYKAPRVFGDQIVYRVSDPGSGDSIILYNITSKQEKKLYFDTENIHLFDFNDNLITLGKYTGAAAEKGLYVIDLDGGMTHVTDVGSDARVSKFYLAFEYQENIYVKRI